MSVPSVTVLMAVHNGQRFLPEAIEGILAQSLSDFEFLIIDDGSTDRTRDIVASYADDRIRTVSNPSNLGLTKSLNVGLRAARADLVARQDADDVSGPGRLEAQVTALSENPAAVLATSYCELIDEDGAVFGSITPPSEPDVLLKRLAAKDSPFPHGSVMIRREPTLEIGGYDERFWFAQDFELWVRLLASSHREIVVVPQVLYRLRKVAPSDPIKLISQRHYAEIAWEQHLRGRRLDFQDVRAAAKAALACGKAKRHGPQEHWLSLSLTALKHGYRESARLYARRAMVNSPADVRLRAIWRLLLSALPSGIAGVVQRQLWRMLRRVGLNADVDMGAKR